MDYAGAPKVGSGPDGKKRTPAKEDRPKIFTPNRKDWLSVAKWLHSTNNDTNEKDKNIRNTVGLRAPFRSAGSY